MQARPSYLGLLNAIALAERRAHALLTAWRDVTPDTALREVLELIAVREWEHAAAFAKRMTELGFGVTERPDNRFHERLELARSATSDAEKFRGVLGYGAEPEGAADRLAALFSDTTIDPATGALLGRYIAEKRDSERRLRAAWDACRSEQAPAAASEGHLLGEIADRLERLTATLEDLKRLGRPSR
jgi:hypothetical protein